MEKPKSLPFKEAHLFAQELKLKGRTKWREWAQTSERPQNIPRNPDVIYKDQGWTNWGDWLGTGYISTKNKTYLPFKVAREFVHSLHFSKGSEWRKWSKTVDRPNDIPKNPRGVYKNHGWRGMDDWIGTGRIANKDREYLPFSETKKFAQSLNFSSISEWNKWAKTSSRPKNIPYEPHIKYKDQGWIDWGDFLGTRYVATQNRIYRKFEEARELVRKLNFKNRLEWSEWAKTENRPNDIPSCPEHVYKEYWISFGDWIGTGSIAPQNRQYRPFKDTREFAQTKKFSKQAEWREWAKTSDKPDDIPANPAGVYKDHGWDGWGDFLGTGYVANQSRMYRSFEKAREFAQTKKFSKQSEWTSWSKTSDKPDDIPANPAGVYKDHGWLGWGNFLGTGNIANTDRIFRSFETARLFAQTLKLSGKDDWAQWIKNTAVRPKDIPANPAQVYKEQGWSGWGDFLGTGNIAPQNMQYRIFEEARAFVQKLNFKNRLEFSNWAKTANRPDDIPTSPERVYKDQGWSGVGDFLGTGYVSTQNRVFQSFIDARTFARTLKFSTTFEWYEWSKTPARPAAIPTNPERTYQDHGWLGWADWFGNYIIWNKTSVLSFLKNIEPILSTLKPVELFAIMQKNGMIAALKRETNIRGVLNSLRDLCSSQDPQIQIQELLNQFNTDQSKNELEINLDDIEISGELDIDDIGEKNELPILLDLKSLEDIDHLVDIGLISDTETIEFLISNRVSQLWQNVLNGKESIHELRWKNGGIHFHTIKKRFLSQYDGACALEIPEGYSFKKEGKIAEPNLMQRLTAYRVKNERRVGNWSGVGAGKTISAILTSRVINAHLTVIIVFNSTIDEWKNVINNVFPNSKIHKKETGHFNLNATCPNYVLLNFEKFQQPNSQQLVKNLIREHHIDFVVLDEIQSVKQRDPKKESLRRQLIKTLVSQAEEKNPNFCMLGMSATPVINNLFEGKTLLELVTGQDFSDLKITNTINNAINLHQKLVLHGIRYRPDYSQKIVPKEPLSPERSLIIDGQDLLPKLKASKKDILSIEQILLEAKLPKIISLIKPGTLIYSHYKEKIIPLLSDFIRRAGFTVGLFTGDDKNGLEAFINKKIDVLIGTAPIGTGVDRLQSVCNRLIIACLPWTASEYEQLIGRIYRQGSMFSEVEVFIPQVILTHNENEWSWDKLRAKRIQFKKTLADAALDGVIPEGILESESSMLHKAMESLQVWIKRVEENDMYVVAREKLKIPLPDDDLPKLIKYCGDFTAMNARINSSNSETTHSRFSTNPAEWYLYHTLYRNARTTWSEIPYEKIATTLKQRPDWVIGDFGCGEALLAELLPNKIHSFDHVAINEKVTSCDLANVPLENAVLDVVVFSLSLMGLNYDQYLKEAYRTLKFGGVLKIAEPKGRWKESLSKLLQKIRIVGFQISGDPSHSDQFIYINATKMI